MHTGVCENCARTFPGEFEDLWYTHKFPIKHHRPDTGKWCYGPIVHDTECEAVDRQGGHP